MDNSNFAALDLRSGLENVVLAHMSHCNISTITSTDMKMPKVELLVLKNNNITSIDIRGFKQLKELDLQGNKHLADIIYDRNHAFKLDKVLIDKEVLDCKQEMWIQFLKDFPQLQQLYKCDRISKRNPTQKIKSVTNILTTRSTQIVISIFEENIENHIYPILSPIAEKEEEGRFFV